MRLLNPVICVWIRHGSFGESNYSRSRFPKFIPDVSYRAFEVEGVTENDELAGRNMRDGFLTRTRSLL